VFSACLSGRTDLHLDCILSRSGAQAQAILRTFSSPGGDARIPRERDKREIMQNERRVSIRKPLERLAYISLPSNNGGLVLDVSEGGVGFHSIAPVNADGPIHFRFAVDSARRIRAVGELVWKDETGKTGGLRFTELPDDVREYIRAWLRQGKAPVADTLVAEPAAMAEAARGSEIGLASGVDIPTVEPQVPAGLAQSSKVDLAPFFVEYPAAEPEVEAEVNSGMKMNLPSRSARNPALLYSLRPPVYSAPSYGLSMFSPALQSDSQAAMAASQDSFPSRHPFTAMVLTIFLASVVGSGIFAYVSTSQAGDALYDFGEKVMEGFRSQPAAKPPAPAENSKIPQR
jgi:PilZ domain